MTVSARSLELRSVAQRVADALPAAAEEVVLTGSVSRGVADEVSDIEMLVVTSGEPELEESWAGRPRLRRLIRSRAGRPAGARRGAHGIRR